MARVLVLSLVFPPDSVSTAQIMGDLTRDLAGLGHAVVVITTTPHYNRDPDAERRQPLATHWGRLVQTSRHAGVLVYHTAMPRKGSSVAVRLIAWTLFHLTSLVVGVVLVRRVDVIVTPSPPLSIGVVAWLLGRWHRAPFIYNVQELHPDIAINLGMVRRRGLIRVLYALERFVYARAARITVIASRMRQRLLEKGVPPAKVAVVPNFVDADLMQPVARPNGFSRAFALDDRFVVSYAGNLGPAQGLETLLDAARLLLDEPGIVFVLVGDGILWSALERRIGEQRLTNVRLIPYQPFARVPEIYGASDVCVVAQAVATGADAVPSKVYRIMACRRPVLAVTDPGSDLAQLVRAAGCGAVVPQDSAAQVAASVRDAHARQAEWRERGDAGRRHVLERFARPVVTAQYDALIRDVVGERCA